MDKKAIIKIKDSIDLFLSNEHFLMVYYMNSRQRKSFRINEETVKLIEKIDGKKNIEDLIYIMQKRYDVSPEYTIQVIELLQHHRIVTEVVEKQSILAENLMQRYNRQINYFSEFLANEIDGIIAQKKVIDSHVLVFGCGAVGGDIAIQLAMSGVGHIILYDCDFVETSDAARHMYYKNEYEGMSKVEALKKELLLINSEIKVESINGFLKPTSDIENLVCNADFIINTLDEPYIGYTASKISRICIKYNKPHYIAGGFDAHLASTGELVIPYITPCIECYANHFKVTLKDWKPKSHPVKERYREIGGLASMSLFSSSYACIEIIKYIAGLIEMTSKYKVRGEFLFHDMSLTYLNVERDPACPICGGKHNET